MFPNAKPNPVPPFYKDHNLCDDDHKQQIDNSSTVLEKIANLYAERLLSDIILEVGGKLFPAHRLILCASSDVFQVMLMNSSWMESQETHIVLGEDSSCIEAFGDFLKYLYTGKLQMNHQLAVPMLTLADKYNVKDLVRLCVDYMCNHVVTASKHNQLISWLQYTHNCDHQDVFSICNNFIIWNFEMISKMEDFGSMEVDVLVEFLSNSDIVIPDELSLFHCVAKWLECQELKLDISEDSSDFPSLVTEVMSHIRFPMMTPRQLASLLIHKLTSRFKDFFVEQMRIAMAFHSNHVSEDNTPPELYIPRLYTTEIWSVSLSIENYQFLPSYGVRTLMFSTPSSLAECDSEPTFDWTLDIYPKGVWFKKFFLIVWQGTLEMPESVSKTVRLSLSLKEAVANACVSVGILLCGKQEGVEHIRKVVRKICIFTPETKMLNINDLIPFNELNDLNYVKSPYLIGSNYDCLKVHVVITPYKF